jgi:cell division protein FtsZ
MSLQEAEKIASSLTYELDSRANVIWGARVRQDYEGKVRCMAIMTGIQSAQIMGPNSESVAASNSNRYPARNKSPAFGERIMVPASSGNRLRAQGIDQII